MKKTIIYSLALFACFESCSKPAAPPPRLPTAVVANPTVQDVPRFLDYPGHVEAYNTVQVQSQIAGELTGMYFNEGTEVKEGQLLFTIDSRPYQAALDKAKAALTQSIASLRYAEETAQRYSKLVQEDYVAKLQYDQYLTNVLVEQGSVEANSAEVETAKLNLEYTTIYSPIHGVAGKKQIDVGNFITVGESPSLIVINQLNPIYASFYVPDVDLPIIQKFQNKGQLKTQVFLNENQNEPFEGKLTLIDNQVNENTGSIFMKATLCNDAKKLWPGEYIEVKVILETIQGAILIPYQAVQIGQKGHFVYVLAADHVVHAKNVDVGQRHDDLVVIESGLDASDLVVIEGQMVLYDGAKINPTKKNIVPTHEGNDSVFLSPIKKSPPHDRATSSLSFKNKVGTPR
jgi:multidrug efflux system membrane fusion protein